MAPNFAVKSESWLDLTLNAIPPETSRFTSKASSPANHRHSIGTLESASSLRSVETGRRNSQMTTASSREHLLIRLRQQSYLNNRSNSSNSLATSNLSRSIELNLATCGEKQDTRASSMSEISAARGRDQRHSAQVTCPDAAKPRTRLERMKAKLARTSGRKAAQQTGSQVARSLSSFSERINGKLDHFRHSWKHFLYTYNQQRQSTRATSLADLEQYGGSGEARLVVESPTMDKRELIGRWIERHHSGRSERPKSLDISRLTGNGKGNADKTTSDCSQINRFNHRESRQDFTSKRADSRSSSSSDTTLVSRQPPSLESISSVSTINSKMSNRQVEQLIGAERKAKKQKQKNKSLDVPEERIKRQPPTSDYWSTVASSDYYNKNQHQQQQMFMPNHQHPLPQLQPILLASDQSEYYLDVASAAKLAAQQQLQQHHQQQMPVPVPVPVQSPLPGQIRLGNNKQQELHSMLLSPTTNLSAQTNQPINVVNNNGMLLPAEMEPDDYCDGDYAVPADESCRLERSQVELVQMIGEGQKGYVFLGKLQSKDGMHIQDVAIKTLKYETEQLIEKLMREAAMMRQFEHPHIIKFLGVCPETPALIAMELAEFGEVKQYLKINRHMIIASQLVLFTFQISTALSYLESKQFVHRDVAARNVLVCSHNCVKLADFGLSRSLQQQHSSIPANLNEEQQQQQEYVAAAKGKLPVRWLAPESLAFRRFTSASDVWMFAVCSWELFQFGQVRPWAHIRNNQVLLAIESGQRLARPPTCPARLYQLMLQCWSYAPIQRPKFRDLKQSLWSIYLTERAREQMELEQQHQQQQQLQLQQQQLQFQQQQHQQQLHLQRRLLAADRYLHQQQQEADQQRLMMLWNQQKSNQIGQQNLQGDHRFSSSSPLHANYSSNLSGYSSTTVDMSNNSSRSSSMGSLARSTQQQQQQMAACNMPRSRWAQQRQMSAGSPVIVPAPIQPPLSPANRLPVDHHRDCEMSKGKRLVGEKSITPPMEKLGETKQQRVERNMRRFQKTPGHLLQKQRSQDSIAANLQESHLTRRHQQLSGLHLDEPSMNRNKRQVNSAHKKKRPLSELHLTPLHLAAGDDAEDESASEAAEEPQWRLPGGWRSASASGKSRLVIEKPLIEPTYEGVQPGEAVQVAEAEKRSLPMGRALLDAKAESLSEEDAVGHLKLANILQALKISPMKAKLTYNASSPLQLQLQHQQHQASCSSQQVNYRALEERRQLAVHQRLLGHIRLAPQQSTRSPAQTPESGGSRPSSGCRPPPVGRAESVDQSLQLLESLISGQTTNESQAQENQRPTSQIHNNEQSKNNNHHQLLLGANNKVLSQRKLR